MNEQIRQVIGEGMKSGKMIVDGKREHCQGPVKTGRFSALLSPIIARTDFSDIAQASDRVVFLYDRDIIEDEIIPKAVRIRNESEQEENEGKDNE